MICALPGTGLQGWNIAPTEGVLRNFLDFPVLPSSVAWVEEAGPASPSQNKVIVVTPDEEMGVASAALRSRRHIPELRCVALLELYEYD